MSRWQKKSKKAPAALRRWIRDNRPTSQRAWEELDGPVKQATRARLHEDQSGLCCYCYAPIKPDHTSHIEHIDPQDDGNRFVWENLALACEGGNASGSPAHCDHAKKDQRLQRMRPYAAPIERFVRLRATTGKLSLPPDTDEAAQHDVEHVLNLNASHLQRLRKAAFESATVDLAGKRGRRQSWRMQPLTRLLAELERRATPLGYQPLIEQWLHDRVRRG